MNQSPGSENNGADSAKLYPESESDIDQHPGDENRDGNSDSGKNQKLTSILEPKTTREMLLLCNSI
ncbi:Hypothetical protein FKW44_021440 [Caligus rogercresseyi]|uniref:Uncharacterized protein n=1 Tax=Caligus rogercresseyi TaxID=217165 RepID=A0A7T8GR99_CALRO|nr:Hypothetical protein FKW44_021440 [Caligus rogercresseyi]